MKTGFPLLVPVLFLAACASSKVAFTGYDKPDSSLVLGDLPSLGLQTLGSEVPVNLERIDGLPVNPGTAASAAATRTLKVPPGSHRVGVLVDFPENRLAASADIRIAAGHVIRLTGSQEDYGYWIQVWDETDGTAKRRLLNEFEIAGITANSKPILQLNPQTAKR